MYIKKLIVQGISYQRTLEFSNGLNLISGEKTSGKSLVLALIDYCLGKQNGISLKVQTELAESVDAIFLEIEIKGSIFTISRSIKKNVSTFWVYHCKFEEIDEFIPEKLDKKSYISFLMNKMGAFEFVKTKNRARSTELSTETISFRDIFRYCFVNQHELGTHSFLSNNYPMKKYKNPIAFEMIFDLIDFSQNDLQSEIVKIQNQVEKNKKDKTHLEGYLEQRGNSDYLDLIDRIEGFTNQIEQFKIRKNEIIHQQNEDKEIVKNNRDYILLNSEIRDLENEINYLRKKIKDIELGIVSNEILLNDYHSEMKDVKATEEINYKLSINDHELICPLCNSKIQQDFHEEENLVSSKKNFKSIINDLEGKIKMIVDIMNTSRKKIEDYNVQINRKSRKSEILSLALTEFSKDVQTPFLPELNSLNVKINNLDKDREILLESKRVFNKIDELVKTIEADETHLQTLKEKLKSMEENGRRKEEIMNSLNKSYTNQMKKMKYLETANSYIDEKTYTPFYKNASVYEQESGGLLECMQLSFLNAVISNKESKFHPHILVLDSISKYFGTNRSSASEEENQNNVINDPEVYLNIFNMFIELSEKAQIIIVENTPPAELNEYVKYTFTSGENGFIDWNKNEFLAD